MRRDARTGSGADQIGKGDRTDSYGTELCSSMPSYVLSSTSCDGFGTIS